MKKIIILIAILTVSGCNAVEALKYHYSFSDHRIIISGEKPEDMRISAEIYILFKDKSCYLKNQAGGLNQPKSIKIIKSRELDNGKRYQIEVPVDIDSGGCEPMLGTVYLYGQNKIYDMGLMTFGSSPSKKRAFIPMKTGDQFTATCGRTLFTETKRPFLASPDCSLSMNKQEIIEKYDDKNKYNYIPIKKTFLNGTESIVLDIEKDRYYQSTKDKLPPVPEGVTYYNSYMPESRL
ncbi:hypothetical protein [Photobacterium indicum]|uniref:hypothetical protein n=1 Tax=Photobacterium indicum TaxID=81447 RepID=UPI003D14B532